MNPETLEKNLSIEQHLEKVGKHVCIITRLIFNRVIISESKLLLFEEGKWCSL